MLLAKRQGKSTCSKGMSHLVKSRKFVESRMGVYMPHSRYPCSTPTQNSMRADSPRRKMLWMSRYQMLGQIWGRGPARIPECGFGHLHFGQDTEHPNSLCAKPRRHPLSASILSAAFLWVISCTGQRPERELSTPSARCHTGSN